MHQSEVTMQIALHTKETMAVLYAEIKIHILKNKEHIKIGLHLSTLLPTKTAEENVRASISMSRNLFCKCLSPIVDFHSLTILRVLSGVFAAGCCWEAARVISESTDYTSRLIGRIPQIPSQNPLMCPWRRLPYRTWLHGHLLIKPFCFNADLTTLFCWCLIMWGPPQTHCASPHPMDAEYRPSGRAGTWINDEEEDCQ